MKIYLTVLRGDAFRFLRGAYFPAHSEFEVLLVSHTSHWLLPIFFTTFFPVINYSPQLHKLGTYFSSKAAKLFHGSSSSDHKRLLFPASSNCSDFLSRNFSITFCPSSSIFSAPIPYLWGIQILMWQNNRRGLLAHYFIFSIFSVFVIVYLVIT